MFLLLDDSPGEEIALLILLLAAATVAAVPQQKAEPSCPSERILVAFDRTPGFAPFGWSLAAKDQALLVSKLLEPENEKRAPAHEILPRPEPAFKGPAVLMPSCNPEQRRKNEYPMA